MRLFIGIPRDCSDISEHLEFEHNFLCVKYKHCGDKTARHFAQRAHRGGLYLRKTRAYQDNHY